MDELRTFVEGMQADVELIEANPRDYRDAEFKFRVAELRRLIDRGLRVLDGKQQPRLRRAS